MMKHRIFRTLLVPVLAIGLTACASTGSSMDSMDTVGETAQAMIRVQNDASQQYMTIYFNNGDDNSVALGNVSNGDTETFVLPVDASVEHYRLIAVSPSDLGTPDVILSESFVAEGNMTINWFLNQNELEIN